MLIITQGRIINKRFNRIEDGRSHYYIESFGTEKLEKFRHEGFIKCKLMHTDLNKFGGSIIVPELILLGGNSLKFIQPLAFSPNLIFKTDEETTCTIGIDISCGQTIRVQFTDRQRLCYNEDKSEIYKCVIYGPQDLQNYYTGEAIFKDEYRLFIKLYHYTTVESAELIKRDNWLRDSAWNFAGNLQLKNIGYVYFTCLEELKCEGDLQQIAMSSLGKIMLKTDRSNRVLTINITQKDTSKLNCQLSYQIEASAISNNHLFRHTNDNGTVWYQICSPFIYRIGVTPPGIGIGYEKNEITSSRVKKFDYIVAGDCTNTDGLRAPYEEENTQYIYKVENPCYEKTNLGFWMDNPNTDHYSHKNIEMQRFK